MARLSRCAAMALLQQLHATRNYLAPEDAVEPTLASRHPGSNWRFLSASSLLDRSMVELFAYKREALQNIGDWGKTIAIAVGVLALVMCMCCCVLARGAALRRAMKKKKKPEPKRKRKNNALVEEDPYDPEESDTEAANPKSFKHSIKQGLEKAADKIFGSPSRSPPSSSQQDVRAGSTGSNGSSSKYDSGGWKAAK